MAAIDFPNAPVDGQTFAAPNGVIYTYNATRGLWLAAGTSQQQSLYADFFATVGSGQSLGAASTYTTVVLPTVVSGNSGGYYNPSNGRFTPPAGRYALSAFVTIMTAGAAGTGQMALFKNGVQIPNAAASCYVTAQPVTSPFAVTATVDANGTDYFEVKAQYQSASASVYYAGFSAVPVGVMQALPPAGTLYLHSEQVLSAPANTLTVSIPLNAKRVDLDMWWTTSPFADFSSVLFQGMSGGSPVSTATYNYMYAFFRDNSTIASTLQSAQTNFSLNGAWAQAHGTMRFERPSAGYGSMDLHGITAGGSRYRMLNTFEGGPGPFDGYRLTASGGAGTFATGSFLRCYAVI